MKNRLQFSVRTSVLKQFFRDVANLRVAALFPRRRKLGERAPSVFPLSAGGCAATRRLDVAAFNYKFTCQNFDQARGVKEGGEGGGGEEWIVLLLNRKKTSVYIFTRATPLVAPKTVNFAPKRNATYMSETPIPNLLSFYPCSMSQYGCSGARAYAGAPLRAPTLRSARIYIKYISVVFVLILAQKGPEMQPYTPVDSGVDSTHQHHIFRFLC